MKSKSFKKRFLALLSCLVMLTASTLTTMAADATIDTTKKGTLHITKYDMTAAAKDGITESTTNGAQNTTVETEFSGYALKGVEFSYLKVANINQVTTASAADPATDASVKVTYTIPEALDQVLGGNNTTHTYTTTELNTLLQKALTDGKKNDLEDYMAAYRGKAMSATDEQGKTSATNLDLGLYLLVETKVPADVNSTTDPFFVSLPITDAKGTAWQYEVYVYPKNQTNQPTLEKKVKQDKTTTTFADTTSAEIGTEVVYRVVSKLPVMTTKATYLKEYTYVDSLSKGLTYDKDSLSIEFYTSEALTDKVDGLTFTKGTDYEVNYNDTENKMTITMTDTGLGKLNPALGEKYMVVTYKAAVGSNAVLGDTGNLNQVVLSYQRTGEEQKDITDGAKVYTYGLNLTKNFSDTSGDATKVKFTLKEGTTQVYAKLTDDVYILCPEGVDGAVTEFSPASDGTLKIKGLKGGTYEMTETATDSGYMLLKEPLKIEITESSATISPAAGTTLGTETAAKTASAKVNEQTAAMDKDGDNNLHAWVKLAVTNNKGFELPKTGGWGTIVFTAIGAVGLAFCIILYMRKRRAEE